MRSENGTRPCVGDVPGAETEILAEPHKGSTRKAQQPRFQPVNPSELCFPAVPRASNERPPGARSRHTPQGCAHPGPRDGGCVLAASTSGDGAVKGADGEGQRSRGQEDWTRPCVQEEEPE